MPEITEAEAKFIARSAMRRARTVTEVVHEITEAEAKFIVKALDEYSAVCIREAGEAHRIAAGLSENATTAPEVCSSRPLTVREEQD